jgi:hypothetical protein
MTQKQRTPEELAAAREELARAEAALVEATWMLARNAAKGDETLAAEYAEEMLRRTIGRAGRA